MNNLTIIILLIIIILIYKLIFCFEFFNKKKEKKHFLVVAAIFKNENNYLDEWIKFNIMQGIDHFYMFDNNDDAGKNKKTNMIFNKYKNKITHIIWNHHPNNVGYSIQRRAYQHCIIKYGKEFQWLLLADIDEFPYSTIKNTNIKDIIKKYSTSKTPFIKIPRFNFGNSGHIKKPKGGVIDNYFYREKYISSYKAINNIDYVSKKYKNLGVHRLIFTTKKNGINKHIKITSKLLPQSSKIPLVMNHYYTKSYEEYLNKCKTWLKKPINYPGRRKDCNNKKKFIAINKNEVLDLRALKIKSIYN